MPARFLFGGHGEGDGEEIGRRASRLVFWVGAGICLIFIFWVMFDGSFGGIMLDA